MELHPYAYSRISSADADACAIAASAVFTL